MRDKYRGKVRSGKSVNYGTMETKKRKYSKSEIARLVVGHGAWIALSFWWGALGLMVGGIFALMTAPRGFYE